MSTQSKVGRVWKTKSDRNGKGRNPESKIFLTVLSWHNCYLAPKTIMYPLVPAIQTWFMMIKDFDDTGSWWSRILVIKDYDDQGGLTRVPAIQTGSQIRQIGTSPNLCRGRTAPLSSSPTYITAKPTDIPDTSNLIWSSTLKCLGRFWAVSQVVQILGSWSSGGCSLLHGSSG